MAACQKGDKSGGTRIFNADKDAIAMHNSDGAQYRGQLCVPCGRDGRAQLPVDARIRIGKKLAQVYDPVLAEPVPARFLNLLARLAQDDKRDNARFPAFAGEGD